MNQPIITLQQITKYFDDLCVLKDINLDVQNGEFLTLLGPSGCGKTTLLRLLAGFETPNAGTITINGQNITNIPPEERHLNMVFQSYALFPHMTVLDNVAFGLRCQKNLNQTEIQEKTLAALQRVKLAHLANRKPHQLSGGQQQRVAIARAIVKEPLVLLLDEPLSALDYALRKSMRIELKTLQRRLGITFILVTHDQEEALSMSDRIVVMNEGIIEQVGAPRDVYEEPKNLYVANFIGEANIFNTKISHATPEKLTVNIADSNLTLENKKGFKTGDQINIIVRPEDIKVWGRGEIKYEEDLLSGYVQEVIYKGSTVDLIVKLSNGQLIAASEFFDEDDENLEYDKGEFVLVRWMSGWEVILPDETV